MISFPILQFLTMFSWTVRVKPYDDLKAYVDNYKHWAFTILPAWDKGYWSRSSRAWYLAKLGLRIEATKLHCFILDCRRGRSTLWSRIIHSSPRRYEDVSLAALHFLNLLRNFQKTRNIWAWSICPSRAKFSRRLGRCRAFSQSFSTRV